MKYRDLLRKNGFNSDFKSILRVSIVYLLNEKVCQADRPINTGHLFLILHVSYLEY